MANRVFSPLVDRLLNQRVAADRLSQYSLLALLSQNGRYAALGLLAVAFQPLASTMLGYRQRDAAFPILLDFEQPRILQFVDTRNADFAVTPPPEAWSAPEGNHVARITYAPVQYPAFIVRELHADWSGYERLEFEIYCADENPVPLVIRIDDAAHNGYYADRFNQRIPLQPGHNRIAIALADVRSAPRDRDMDLSRMRSLTLFAGEPSEAITYWVDGFRLVK